MNRNIAAAIVAALLLTACGPLKYALQSSDKAPGSDATLTADVHPDQGNSGISFSAVNLAPPDRVESGDTAFVAWWRKDDKSPWQRLGALKYDPDKRIGSMESASVPEVAFDFEVSDEKAVDPASPSSTILFAQHVQKK